MKNKKFDKYNDGVLFFGELKEIFDINLNATHKEFTVLGKLFFAFKNIRYEDRERFDGEHNSLELKVQTPIINNIGPNDLIEINNIKYSIIHIDKNMATNRMFIYLETFIDKLDKLITLEKRTVINNNGFEESNFNHFKTIFAQIIDKNSNENIQNGILNSKISKNITIRYNKELDDLYVNSASKDFRIKFEENIFNIVSIKNINNSFLEFGVELIG